MVLESVAPLVSILRAHKEWVENPEMGARADLSGMTLNEVK